jgi:hypothetical protein
MCGISAGIPPQNVRTTAWLAIALQMSKYGVQLSNITNCRIDLLKSHLFLPGFDGYTV